MTLNLVSMKPVAAQAVRTSMGIGRRVGNARYLVLASDGSTSSSTYTMPICVGIVRPERKKVPEDIDHFRIVPSNKGNVMERASCNFVPFHPSILTA